jgi:hypothetical protein
MQELQKKAKSKSQVMGQKKSILCPRLACCTWLEERNEACGVGPSSLKRKEKAKQATKDKIR